MELKNACAGFKIINNYFENQLNIVLANYNLTRSQMDILVFLQISETKNNEVNQKDIEQHLSLKNPTITGILDRLEDKGYIKREVSFRDKRYKKIVLTQSGYEILEKGRQQAIQIEKKLLSPLDRGEKEELKKLLDKIIIKVKEEIC